jgi:hypothetical protein
MYEKNDIVVDEYKEKIGRVVDFTGGRYLLRPLEGGVEWEAMTIDVRRATPMEEVHHKVLVANAHTHMRAWVQSGTTPPRPLGDS